MSRAFVLFSFSLMFALVPTCWALPEQVGKPYDPTFDFKKCIGKGSLNITQEDYDVFMGNELMKREKVDCFQTCILQEMKLVTGRTVDIEMIKEGVKDALKSKDLDFVAQRTAARCSDVPQEVAECQIHDWVVHCVRLSFSKEEKRMRKIFKRAYKEL